MNKKQTAWLMDNIKQTYGVPVKKGGRIKFQGKPGTIVGVRGAYLRVRLDGEDSVGNYHPTWEMEYVAD